MAETRISVEERPSNWLPVPGGESDQGGRQAMVDEADLFAKGVVQAYYSRQGEGLIKNDRGLTIPFSFSHSELVGRAEDIEEGLRVGYDASVTAHGMRVTRLKVY